MYLRILVMCCLPSAPRCLFIKLFLVADFARLWHVTRGGFRFSIYDFVIFHFSVLLGWAETKTAGHTGILFT